MVKVKVKWNLGKLTTRKDKSTEERTANWGIQPLQFVQILKSLKYSLGNSVSDVIDNSIDIGATDIDVYFETIVINETRKEFDGEFSVVCLLALINILNWIIEKFGVACLLASLKHSEIDHRKVYCSAVCFR